MTAQRERFTVEGVDHRHRFGDVRSRCSCGWTGTARGPVGADEAWRAHVRAVVEEYLARLSARDRNTVSRRTPVLT